ncbi:MAG TPA: HEAT repeat domain-containing protein [Kofleriaceae bacterium]
MQRLPALLLLVITFGCGAASPEARRARGEMRDALGAGDARRAVQLYESWRAERGEDDPAALRLLARTTLWQALRAQASAIQTAAIQAVERLEIEELAPDVAELVSADDDRVAAAAAAALLTAHPHAPRVLVDLLKSEDPEARALAVDGIGRKAREHARGDLVPMLDDPDPRVRREAVGAVARFAEGEDLERLAAMAKSDKDGSVRARALRALASRHAGGHVGLAAHAATDPFLGARFAAVDLLARDDSAEARAALDQLVAGKDLPIALAAAAARLRAGGDAANAGVFDRALGESDWTARAAALNSAAAAPRSLALRLGGRGLVDRNDEVRLAAARLLIRLGVTTQARKHLEAALASKDPAVRIDAAVDLLRLGDERASQALDELARDPAVEVRRAAVGAHASARRLTPGLVAALADADPALRVQASELILELL